MRYYEASSMIASSPEAVWAVLTDGAAWPSWDSGVDRLDGQISPGEKITIRSQAAPGRAFPVKVTDFDPPVWLRFSGGMPLGLFRVYGPSRCRRHCRRLLFACSSCWQLPASCSRPGPSTWRTGSNTA
jgi:hypothetical protein